MRARTTTARVNWTLLTVLCHNSCCLIHMMYTLSIEVDFVWKATQRLAARRRSAVMLAL